MLIDAPARESAASDFERNVIVTAGAGTGKTRLLVDRLTHLLVGRNVPLRRIVALTFTEKAAGEMRVRLGTRLEELLQAARGSGTSGRQLTADGGRQTSDDKQQTASHRRQTADGRPQTVERVDDSGFQALRDKYRLSTDEIAARAAAARAGLDQALIGTIHSFAAHILRLFPVEAGVDPGFEVDTGTGFEAAFSREWAAWLGEELGRRAPRREAWLAALDRADLGSLGAVARAMSDFLVPVPPPPAERARKALAESAAALADAAGESAARGPAKNRLADQLRTSEKLLRAVAARGPAALAGDPDAEEIIGKEVSKAAKGWAPGDYEVARERAAAARGLLKLCGEADDAFIDDVVALLQPFVHRFRDRFLTARRISFDGLLARARDLVGRSLRAQESLKRGFEAILVDEFQDTDPVQAELLLFLGHRKGRPLHDPWKAELTPGKLFVVGDPKQSIYGFRRADIGVFERFCDVVRAQGGVEHKLVSNFRSRPGVLAAVNAVFGRLIRAEPGVQPPYVDLAPGLGEEGTGGGSGGGAPPVELRLVACGEKRAGGEAEAVREAESEWIARWIDDYVGPGAKVQGHGTGGGGRGTGDGGLGTTSYRDVVLLLRALTPVHTYLDAFKRHGIPYVVEGERHFFLNPEVVDVINILRAVENPHDRIALAGVLRSPVGAAPDGAILALAEADVLDYRKDVPAGVSGGTGIQEVYEQLRDLHGRARRLPLDGVVDAVYDQLPVLEAASLAYHGEQRVANLMKVRRMAAEWGREPELTLAAFVRRLRESLERGAQEGESPLADETLDAVRVLSIHKAKGLEFPVVILGNLHGETRGGGEGEAPVTADGLTGLVGITAGGARNTASIVLAQRARRREEAETRRVLYVAMTRAKERLILSGATKAAGDSLLALVEEAGGTSFKSLGMAEGDGEEGEKEGEGGRGKGRPGEGVKGRGGEGEKGGAEGGPKAGPPLTIDGVGIPVTLLPREEPAAPKARVAEPAEREADWVGYREVWERRRERAAELESKLRFISPSSLETGERGPEIWEGAPDRVEPEGTDAAGLRPGGTPAPAPASHPAAIVGTVCHRVLEGWNFKWDAKRIPGAVRAACDLLRAVEARDDWDDVAKRAEAILRGFYGGKAYRWIEGCEILGRELPVLFARDGQVVRGVMDLLVRDGRLLTIVDYKTDEVGKKDLAAKAEEYRLQGEAYREAVRGAAGRRDVGFKLVFLRDGAEVEVR